MTDAEYATARPGADLPARAIRRPVRRVPRPRLAGLLDSPVRNLLLGVLFTLAVMTAATGTYMALGWGMRDAVYMVVLTVFTVGYSVAADRHAGIERRHHCAHRARLHRHHLPHRRTGSILHPQSDQQRRGAKAHEQTHR